MKLELKPQIDSLASHVGPAATNSGISKDGQVRWVYENSYLEVIRPRKSATLASWRFGKVLQDNQTSITAVTDIKTKAGHLLLVATSNISDCGAINIFSVKLRRVIRVIEVPKRISALEVVFANETEDVSPWIISKHLQFFSGLLAVGTEGGYIYLVDLCLDELDTTCRTPEADPKRLMVISPRIVDPVAKREQALSYDKHLALLLDEQCHRQEQFYYRRQDDSVQKVLEEDTVYVSTLKYMAQAGTLAVGFNFGCFQLWRLYNPVLDYSSRYSADGQAVTHFLVQEPENDPRNFVYLWVGYDNAYEDSISNICLYQLSFTKKDAYANFGIFFDELESVCLRLDHTLTTDPYSVDAKGTSRSTIVSCYTLENPLYTPPAILSDSFEEGFHGNDLSLSIFVWRADSKQAGRGSAASHYYLSIFDMNRWYHAQMPYSLRCRGASLQVCPFWAVYNLEEIVAQLPSQTLLNVEVSGNKVLRFTNNMPVPPEEHSYPSALQLCDIHFVLADGSVQGQCLGWQGQLLREMVHNGAEYLVQPADFYHQCLRARLLPQSFEDTKNKSTDYQRKMLLNMALERGRAPALIPQCIRAWEDGSFAEQGCTLTMLLNWAWQSVITTKNSLDSACTMLYDWSGLHLDQRTDWQIAQLTQTLSHIRQILTYFTIQATPTTERGQFELELRQGVVVILLKHCEVVRWAISFTLLPEIDEASEPSPHLFAFPASELVQAYKNRRAELRDKKGTIDGMGLLLVDSLVDCQGPHIRQVWENFGGDGAYPPPSMQAMMNMYLIEEVNVEVKHAIMLYFLQDLATLDRSPEREAAIASFIQRFMLSPSLVHHVQGLWFIDHRDFEEGIRHLVNANVHEDLCGSFRHASVVNTLLAQGQGRLANCYTHTKPVLGASPHEQQLYISVLIDNSQVSQALEFLRGWDDEKTSARLMGHLLKECQSHKLLGKLLQLNLTKSEECALDAHLRARPEPHALEPLLLYYLHRSRFLQAFQLNQEMNMRDKLETSLASQEKSVTRNRLMEAYLKVLPEVTRKMLTEKQTTQAVATSARRIQMDQPKPLSTVVRQADFSGMSQARFIMAVIDKISEAKTMLIEDEEEEEQEEEKTNAQSLFAKDGFEEDMTFDVPFLSTPRTPRHSSAKRKSEIFPSAAVPSPLASKSLSYSARKTLSIVEAVESPEEKKSLRQLAAECLQVLQTPVRDHKRKSMSPGFARLDMTIKTPQSILKVRRLSKTLPSSREKLSSRRTSGSRPSVRLGVSRSDTSHNASSSLPSSVEKPAAGTTETTTSPYASTNLTTGAASTAALTPKQLRFIGVSPSPTPSPSLVNMSVSLESERSEEIVQRSGTVSPPAATSPDPVSKVLEVTTTDVQEPVQSSTGKEKAEEEEVEMPMEEGSPSPLDGKTLDTPGSLLVDTGHSEEDPQSLEEGPDDRYSDKFSVLVRPDLQSPWKQHSPEMTDVRVDEDISFHVKHGAGETASSTASPVFAPPSSLATDRENRNVTRQELTEEQVTVSHTAEKLTVWFSQETVSSSSMTRHVQLETSKAGPGQDSGSRQDSSSFLKPVSPTLAHSSLSQRKSSSVSPKASPKSLSSGLLPISIETSALVTSSKPDESPPATPPSSKRAKLMSSKGDDIVGLVESQTRSTLSLEEGRETTRRRKTPERRSPARQQKTSEDPSLSPSEERETRRRKTPDRRSPARQQKNSEDPGLSPSEERETRRRKTPERVSLAWQRNNAEEPVRPSLSPSEERVTRSRKTPERQSPARQQQSTEESARKTLERDSPARKLRKLREEQESSSVDDDATAIGTRRSLSPMRTRRKTPERKSPARTIAKTSAVDLTVTEFGHSKVVSNVEEKTVTAATLEQSKIDSAETFTSAEIVLGDVSEPENSPEVPVRRRSARLNTPDRSVVEPAGAKSTKEQKLREKTPPRKVVEQKSLYKEEKLSGAEEMESKTEPSIAPISRRSTRYGTPDRSVAEAAEGKPLTPTRGRKQKEKTPSREVDNGDSSSKGEENLTPSRSSSRKKQTTRELPQAEDTRESDAKEDDEEPLPVELSNLRQTTTLRKSRRQSRTPDKLATDYITEMGSSKKRQEAKTPDNLLVEKNAEDTQLRKSTRQPGTPDRLAGRQSKTPDRLLDEAEPVQQTQLRRSSRQSKTPDRQPARESVEPMTPTRRSRRQIKTPEVLNTDEIEPLPSPSVSPKRAAPKMSDQRTGSPRPEDKSTAFVGAEHQQLKSTVSSTGRKMPVAEVTDQTEIPQSPARRSTRKAKSPERLNTDMIQPVSPHSSPTRSKVQHGKPQESEDEKNKAETAKGNIAAHNSTDMVAQSASFIFSPPLKHSLRSQDSLGSESFPPDPEQQQQREELPESQSMSSNPKLQFVFSKPSVASPPKKEDEQPVKKSKRKKRHKLYNEDEVLLLSPLPTPPMGTRFRPMQRKRTEAQRATAEVKKKDKTRRLVPSSYKAPS